MGHSHIWLEATVVVCPQPIVLCHWHLSSRKNCLVETFCHVSTVSLTPSFESTLSLVPSLVRHAAMQLQTNKTFLNPQMSWQHESAIWVPVDWSGDGRHWLRNCFGNWNIWSSDSWLSNKLSSLRSVWIATCTNHLWRTQLILFGSAAFVPTIQWIQRRWKRFWAHHLPFARITMDPVRSD